MKNNINYSNLLSNIDKVLKIRPILQEKIADIKSVLSLPDVDATQQKENIQLICSYKKLDINVKATSPNIQQILQAQTEYNKVIDELDNLKEEYTSLRANTNNFFKTYSPQLFGSLFGEYCKMSNIIYDDDMNTFIDKDKISSLLLTDVYTSFCLWLVQYIHYLTINFDNMGDSSKEITVDFKDYKDLIDANRLSSKLQNTIIDYCEHEHYVQNRIREIANNYDGKDYITGFGQAFLGLEDSQLTNDAMRMWLSHPFFRIMYNGSEKYANLSIFLNAKGGTGKSFIVEQRLAPALKKLFGNILTAYNLPTASAADVTANNGAAELLDFKNNIYAGLSDWTFHSGQDLIALCKKLNEPQIRVRTYYKQVYETFPQLSVPFLTVNQDFINMMGDDGERRIIKLKSIDPATSNTIISDIKRNYKIKFLDQLVNDGLFEKIITQACWLSVNCAWDEAFKYDEKGNEETKKSNSAPNVLHIAVSFAKYIINMPSVELNKNGEIVLKTSNVQEYYDYYKALHKSIATWSLSRLMKDNSFNQIFQPKRVKDKGKEFRVRVLNPNRIEEYEAKLSAVIERVGVFADVNEWPAMIINYYNKITGESISKPHINYEYDYEEDFEDTKKSTKKLFPIVDVHEFVNNVI